MRKVLIPLVISFLFTSNLFSQFSNGWELQNYFSYTGTVNDLIYFPSSKIVAVGDYGEIYYSENGGIDMQKILPGFTYHLKALCFRDSLTGYASGHGGTIIKTTNGGKNWETLSSGITDNIFDIEVNGNYVIAVGERGKILKSTDEGTSWQLMHSNNSYYLLAVKFFNNDTGNAVGSDGVILRTTTAGETWFSQNTGINFNGQYIDMDISGGRGIVSGDSTVLLYTSDEGSSWMRSTADSNFKKTIYRIKFYDSLNIVGLGDGLIKSTNGGITFDVSYYTPRIKALSFITLDSVYSGRSKRIEAMNLSSYPNRWSFPFNSANILYYTALFPVNDMICWAGGQQYENSWNNTILFNTSDGGSNWNNIYFEDPAQVIMRDIQFQNPDTGYLFNYYPLTNRNVIYKTLNGGETWNSLIDTSGYYSSKMQIINNRLYMLNHETIRRYTLEGNFIDTIPRPFDMGLYQGLVNFQVINDSTIYVLTDYRREIFRTHNNGKDWTKLIRYTGGWFNDFHFINDEVGFIVGNDATIFKTTHSNLLEQIETGSPNPSQSFYSVWMSDIYNIYICGSGGVIYSSHDGGVTWTLNQTNVTSAITRIRFIDAETGWAVGDNGVILKTTTGGTYWENEPNEIPVKYVLYQNYPNPFNPVTTIKFDIPDDIGDGVIMTRLAIYDIVGRQVSVLVDRDLEASSYSYTFDASSLPSGVYFYKLTAGSEFSQTKKMVLIR